MLSLPIVGPSLMTDKDDLADSGADLVVIANIVE